MKSLGQMQKNQIIFIPLEYQPDKDVTSLFTQNVTGSQTVLTLPEGCTFNVVTENDNFDISNVNETVNESNKEETENTEQDISASNKSTSDIVKCNLCGEIFSKKLNYKQHLEFHRTTKKYKCKHCFESYNVEDNYLLHSALHNPGTPTCPLCDRKFQRLASLKSHLIIHQVEETFTCKECLAEFDTEVQYNKHLEKHMVKEISHTESTPYVCSYCNYAFDDPKEYKEHISYHIKLKKLVYNPRKTRRKTTGNKDYPHKCNVCGKSFSKSCLLERHYRIHSGEKPYACHKCDKKFSQKNTLQIHLVKHAGQKHYKCTLCPASFFQKGNLRVHVEKTHTVPRDASKIFKCTQCTCVFKKVASLNAHVTKVHTSTLQENDIQNTTDKLKELQQLVEPIIDFVPNTSNAGEIRNNNSKGGERNVETYVKLSHNGVNGVVRQYMVLQKTIEGSKYYVCSYCSKKMKKPSDLIRHIRVHTKEKPFECPKCDEAFCQKSTLTTHLNTHKNGKQHSCWLCKLEFSSLKELATHVKSHDVQVLKYKCSSCDRLFNTFEEIKKHMDIHDCPAPIDDTVISNSNNVMLRQPMLETDEGLISLPPPKIYNPYTSENSKERPYKCHVCNGEFLKPIHLKEHMNVHSGNKKFPCDICKRCFSSPSTLKNHKYSHYADNKHQCGVCLKRFTTKILLKRHQEKHNSTKNYVCPYCKKRFKNNELCRKHINGMHKSERERVEDERRADLLPPAVDDNLVDLQNNFKLNNVEVNEDQLLQADGSIADVSSLGKGKINFFTLSNGGDVQMIQNNQIADNQDVQTVYITYNDLQNMDSDVLDGFKTPLQTVNPLLIEQQDVNILLMDSLSQSHDFQNESNNFQTYNPVLFSDTVNADINLSNAIVNIPITVQTDAANVDDSNILNDSAKQKINLQNKIILKATDDKETAAATPTVALASTEGLNQNLVITLNDLQNMTFGINDQNANDGDINLTADNILIGADDACITCAICKFTCGTIEELAKHHCELSTSVGDQEAAGDLNVETVDCARNASNDGKKVDSEEVANKKNQRANNYLCQYCSKPFKKSSDLRRHERTHTGEKPYKCETCGKCFSLKCTLKSHMRTHEPGDNKKHKCHVCNLTYSCKASLKTHMSIHTGVKAYQCHLCDAKFRTSAHRKTHLENHDKKIQRKKNLKSDIKNTINYTNNYFESLLQTNTDIELSVNNENVLESDQPMETDNQMSQITESFTIGDSLHIDLLQQLQSSGLLLPEGTGDVLGPSLMQFDIEVLDKDKIDENVVENSGNVEDKTAKRFTCDVCGKTYSTNSVLKKHQKKHKKLGCTQCDKCFDTNEALEQHAKTHLGYRPYSCMHCANSFLEEASLKIHMKRIHEISS